MSTTLIIVGAAALALLVGLGFLLQTGAPEPQEPAEAPEQTAEEEQVQLQVGDAEEGTGPEAEEGDRLSVHYRGALEDGTVFDSSYDRGQPFEFVLGAEQVIAGWELGIAGMKEGGTRVLIIPPELAYGSQGVADIIPPDATLTFEVELVEVQKP